MNPVPPSCSECQDTGWLPTSKDDQTGVQRCECYKRARAPRLVEFARIPPRYKTATLGNFLPGENPYLQQALNDAEFFVNEYPMAAPQGLLFMGPPGVGKTHLAVGIIQALMQTKSVPCLFCDFPDLLREIQNSYNPLTHGSEELILTPILDAKVLILDDLGSQKWSEWVQDMLAHVINDRYKHGHSTIFTTNYLDPKPTVGIDELEQTHMTYLKNLGVIDEFGNIDQFKMQQLKELGIALRAKEQSDTLESRIGDRLRSRLSQMCKTVKIAGEDFRRKKGIQPIR